MVRDRIATAQWILERQLAWIAAADTKVAALVAISTAMLGGLAAAFSTASDPKNTWTLVLCVFAVIAYGATVFYSALALFPRTVGPRLSLLFFGPVSALAGADYADQLKIATDDQILEDWSLQIHRNAQIAMEKHACVRKGMTWAFVGSPAWGTAIFLMIKV